MSTDPRSLVKKTLEFESPERIPRQVWLLPWAEEHYPVELKRLHKAFPDDIFAAPALYKSPLHTTGDRYKAGTYVDEWGCIFSNHLDGTIGMERISGRDSVIPQWRCPACHTDNARLMATCGCGYDKAHRPEVTQGLPDRDPLWQATRSDLLLLVLLLLAAWYFW